MHKKFDHNAIEKKWQKKWRESDIYKTDIDSGKEKAYVLDMFPYPSGEGLHVGHPKGYIATDIYSRFKKMSGYEVLHPMGWDAFGLPAENFAIKNKVHPRVAVEKNIENFKNQLEHLGFNYDWSREINTTDPDYYKWTQWIFLKLLEKGLAYESYEPINWCPSCQTGLANEDLESDGTCERCDSVVEKRPMRQWVLKITEYADRMLEDLDTLTAWPEHIKEAQRNWIGRSEGVEIDFEIKDIDKKIKVFTTRPDTLFGATYMVLAPEHKLVNELKDKITNWDDVLSYMEVSQKKSEQDRLDATKEKTGVKLEGVIAINSANDEEIPIYIADYVLSGYGTGAIMAVPAHDERDYAFAKQFDLPIKQVIVPCYTDHNNHPKGDFEEIKRNTVVVHLRDKSTGKFALLRWHGSLEGVTTAIMGGIEDGQTPEEAALTEIKEEASISDATITKKVDWVTASKYCASHKKENRHATVYAFMAEVDNLKKQGKISQKEQEVHTLDWIEKEKMREVLGPEHQKILWDFLHAGGPLIDKGSLINSGEFDGMDSEEAKEAITKKVDGQVTVTYRLNDWVFSRQRYWGEPIPVIHCEKCGVVPVPEKDLPVTLPEVENYEPTGTGESPLANIEEWVNVPCPKCDGKGKRETNTMPQWAGSSWYYLRFIDPDNTESFVDSQREKEWMPVDVYVGGDHAVRHLIYARFWHKFLYDIGMVSTTEPFTRLEFLGFILAEDGKKMSKRWGNVINPDDIVAQNGADTLRVYEMFMGPFENTIAWSTNSLVGAQRFLERVYGLSEHVTETEPQSSTTLLHKTIDKVSRDIEAFKFNTAVSTLMIYVNHVEKEGLIKESYEVFLKLLAPFAPHLAEELWEASGREYSVHTEGWPVADKQRLVSETATIAVQFNGKVRGTVEVSPEATEEEARNAVLANEKLSGRLEDIDVSKIVYVSGKIINFIG